MKKLKIHLYNFLIVLSAFSSMTQVCNAQTKKIRPVKIGEKVPDFFFSKVLQYSKPSVSLGELKGKAVILDIWSVGCGPCIAAFPKMEKLQKLFGDELLILPVSYSLEGPTVKFLKARKGTEFELKLPTVVYTLEEEKAFKALFPFLGIPHEIWIDKEGILRATTDETFVNEGVINKFLKGLPVDWTMQTLDPDYKEGDVLFAENMDSSSRQLLYKSSMSGFQNGVQAGNVFYKDSSVTRITMPNKTLLELIKTSLSDTISYLTDHLYVPNGFFDSDVYNKQLLIKAKDKDRFFWLSLDYLDTAYSKWIQRNVKCYELIIPSDYRWDEAFAFMRTDLERFFKINITVQQLPVRYLALVKDIGYDGSIESTTEQTATYKMADDESFFMFQNRPVELLTSYIQARNKVGPLIKDETGIKGNVNISLALAENENYQEYNNRLKKFGLILKENSATMPVLVISDK
ncbi:TlpA family protein disulfide reductase [Flavobacterium sp. RHBU_24]|uniref:TlpA family protein disulfide reductase n=1 Tax=Flavobacterium sp. RHBU_24 TaxID=3391185 RepID=UPI003984C56B